MNLQADDDKWAQLPYTDSHIQLAASAETAASPITLEHAATIEGTIDAPADVKVDGISVRANNVDPSRNIQIMAVSDASGRYKLNRMPPGAYNLVFDLMPPLSDTWACHPLKNVYVKAGQAATGTDAQLVKGAIVAGHVTYKETGAPAVGVTVRAMSDDGVWGNTVTDAGGRYRLCIAGGDLTISVPVGNTYFDGSGPKITAQDGQTTVYDLTTEPAIPPLKITGRVLNADGAPAIKADVLSVAFGQGMPQTVQTDDDGAFSFTVNADAALVRLSASLGDAGTDRPIAAVGGDNVTLKLADHIAGGISGTVTDADGGPISGAAVNLQKTFGNMSIESASTTTDAQGAYIFSGLMPDSDYSVSVTAAGYWGRSSAAVALDSGKTTPIDPLKLDRADGYLSGQAVDPAGRPVPGASIMLIIDHNGKQSGVTDANGKFHITDIPQGQISLSLRAQDMDGGYSGPTNVDDVVVRMQSTAPPPGPAAAFGAPAPAQPVDFVGRDAPEFQVAGWVDCPPLSMASLRGKYVIVDNYGCCADSLKQTQELMRDYGRLGVVCIGLCVPDTGQSPASVQSHLTDEKIDMPVAVDAAGPPGIGGLTAAGLGIHGFEGYALIDRAGTIAYAGFQFENVVTTLSRMIAADQQKGAAAHS